MKNENGYLTTNGLRSALAAFITSKSDLGLDGIYNEPAHDIGIAKFATALTANLLLDVLIIFPYWMGLGYLFVKFRPSLLKVPAVLPGDAESF